MASNVFTYTGAVQTYTVPAGITSIYMVVSGAAGEALSGSSYSGGLGAQIVANVPVTAGHVLSIYVGGRAGVYGGTESAYNGVFSGDGSFVVDTTAGTVLLAAGGGGAADGTANGGAGGQTGGAGGGTDAGGAATQSAGGSSAYQAGTGPASFSGTTLTVGKGGIGYQGPGGGGYYGGGGGGYPPQSTFEGYQETSSTTSTEAANYAVGEVYYADDGDSNPETSSSGHCSTASFSVTSGSEASGQIVTTTYNDIYAENVSYYEDNDTEQEDYISQSQTTTTTNYSPVYSYTAGVNGSGGGGSSYAIDTASNVSFSSGAQSGTGQVAFGVAPTVPTQTSPASGGYVDFTQDQVFVATYNNDDGSTCAAYELEFAISGSTSQSYFNATTSALQSTDIWNAGGMNVTIPANTLSNGTTYQWAFNSESSYEASLTSGFASPFIVVGQAGPVVVVSAPSGTVGTSAPIIEAAATCPSGAVVTAYRAMIYLDSVVSASGFTWGQSGAVWDSGVTTGTLPSSIVPTAGLLVNDEEYVAGVMVVQSGNQNSAWAESPTFTTSFTVPATPVVVATPTTDTNGTPVVYVQVGSLTVGATLTVSYTNPTTPTATALRYGNAIPVTSTTMVVPDYESAIGVSQTYTAVQVVPGTADNDYTVFSSVASTAVVAAPITSAYFYAIDPLNPNNSTVLYVTGATTSEHEDQTAHYPLGQTLPIVEADTVTGIDGVLTVQTMTLAEFETLENMYRSQQAIWLVSPIGDSRYVRFGAPPVGTGIAGQLGQTTLTKGSTSTDQIRTVVLQYVQVAAP